MSFYKNGSLFIVHLPPSVSENDFRGLLNGFSKATDNSEIPIGLFPQPYQMYAGNMIIPVDHFVQARALVSVDTLHHVDLELSCSPRQYAEIADQIADRRGKTRK